MIGYVPTSTMPQISVRVTPTTSPREGFYNTMQTPLFLGKKLTAILLQCEIVLVRGPATVLQSQALVFETRKRN